MAPRRHRRRHGLGGQAGADREAAAERLGRGQDIGGDAGPLMGEQLAGAAHAALHLVEHEDQAELVGGLP